MKITKYFKHSTVILMEYKNICLYLFFSASSDNTLQTQNKEKVFANRLSN